MNYFIGMALVLGIMILVHEWGHFIAARFFGVRVDVFSIGFGPRLFGIKRGATDYRLSALPLGGYVRMAGQDLSEVDSSDAAPTGSPDELMSKPRWQRAVIAFAGPAVNLVFPLILLTGFFLMVGMPYPAVLDKKPEVVAFPAKQQPEADGLRIGDRILSINGIPAPDWKSAEKAAKDNAQGGSLLLQVENAGSQRSVSLKISDPAQPGKIFGFYPLPTVIDETIPGFPADKAGIKDGDKILAVNGQPIQYWEQFVELARASKGNALRLDLERKGRPVHISVTPMLGVNEARDNVYQIGVGGLEETAYRRVGLKEGLAASAAFTIDKTRDTIGVVGKLFSGRVSVGQLQGVVGITRAAGRAVNRGAMYVVSLMAFISVNLGVLNLLPIPILDGGQILLLSIEGIRRRDLSLKFKERFVQVGLVFLLALFAYVMYNDVSKLFTGCS